MTTMDDTARIQAFYEAFGRRDAEGMAACYAPKVVFSDSVFPHLEGEAARDMWRMLCERGEDLKVELVSSEAISGGVRAQWVAHYSFGPSKRPVVNRIEARFVLEDGLIVRHVDRFDLWAWASQALGPMGWLLGWLPPVQATIRKQAGAELAKYSARRRAQRSH